MALHIIMISTFEKVFRKNFFEFLQIMFSLTVFAAVQFYFELGSGHRQKI
jgi:hypothetical protein